MVNTDGNTVTKQSYLLGILEDDRSQANNGQEESASPNGAERECLREQACGWEAGAGDRSSCLAARRGLAGKDAGKSGQREVVPALLFRPQ